jgi:hypothetical protein
VQFKQIPSVEELEYWVAVQLKHATWASEVVVNPGGQIWQEVESTWNEPTGQAKQLPWPAAGTWPEGQDPQSPLLATEEIVPAGHNVHWPLDPALPSVDVVPSGQIEQANPVEYWPAGHGMQTPAVEVFECWPAEQDVHIAELPAVPAAAVVPGGQTAQEVLLADE